MRKRRHDLDDDESDIFSTLEDGEALRIPFAMMDGLQKDVAAYAAQHKPGFRCDAADAQDEVDRQYELMRERMSNGWKQNRGVGSQPAAVKPSVSDADHRPGQADADAQWHRMVERMASVWQTGRGLPGAAVDAGPGKE